MGEEAESWMGMRPADLMGLRWAGEAATIWAAGNLERVTLSRGKGCIRRSCRAEVVRARRWAKVGEGVEMGWVEGSDVAAGLAILGGAPPLTTPAARQ